MKAVTKITFLDDNGERFFGEGPARLLHGVEETGSLRQAAISMGMAYTKAHKIIKHAEEVLEYPLMTRAIGGKDGGGSHLTAEGKAWLQRYDEYAQACKEANQQLYQQFFGENSLKGVGCVIMASGLGKRFGGNKLMADFHGEPMVCRILDATEGIFEKRVVVTRHEDLAELCRQRQIPVILHSLPHRSDTVRLGMEEMGEMDRCMFCPSDQPLLTRDTILAMVKASTEGREAIWRASFGEEQGTPVVFPRWTFAELKELPEGKGGNWIIKKYPEHLRLVNVRDRYELKDVDTPEELRELSDHTICR